ncbi:hypothetical protein Glove_23g88 [Diversispora epigaea]|uniref:Uncharacterized protein n=1 Tax=Diversispora epigaea TaxID=1348612 RepID=A0A397JK07_9GLOM|nr:hypothetical protein Glove_23g88 [Diversispora epigaea]
MIVENNIGYGTPLAFGLSNKENNWSIYLAVNAVKQNIPCNNFDCEHLWQYENLLNNKRFKRIQDCNNQIDKYRPSKLGVEGLVHGIILSQRRTEEMSFGIASIYKNFINSLQLTQEQKHSLINNLDNYWICNKWQLQFIDAGHLPDASNSNPMTTNNYTERMNCKIESKLSEKTNRFVEEYNHLNYYYVKKYHQSKISMNFFYNKESIELEKDNIDYLRLMIEQLTKNYHVELRDGFYIINIVTGECPLYLLRLYLE